MTKREFSWLSLISLVLLIGGVWWVLAVVASPEPEVWIAPNEANRVFHPWGFSIVRPQRMKESIEGEAGTIGLLPDGGSERYTIGLHVRRLPDDTDLNKFRAQGYTEGSFQDQPALIYIGESGEYNAWRAIFSRDAHWYQLALLFPYKPPVMPPAEWLAYLNTFRGEPID